MRIMVSPQNPTPLYRQVVEQMKKQILLGELKPHQPVPSIRQLARELMISVITTKRAYEDLEREGFIYTRVGKGSFVAAVDKVAQQEETLLALKLQMRIIVQEAVAAGIVPEELLKVWREVLAEEGDL